jgi:hypothetical protein
MSSEYLNKVAFAEPKTSGRKIALAIADCLWHKSSVPLFIERFVLPLFATAVILLALSNPMGFDIQQRVSGALALICAAYFLAHTIHKRSLPVPPQPPSPSKAATFGPKEIEPRVQQGAQVSEENWLALYREKQQLEDELESLELPEPESSWKDRPIMTAGEIASGPLRRMTYSERYEDEKRDRRIQRIKKELAFIDERLKDRLK